MCVDLIDIRERVDFSKFTDVNSLCDKLFKECGDEIAEYVLNNLSLQLSNSRFAEIDILDCKHVSSSIYNLDLELYESVLKEINRRIQVNLRELGYYASCDSDFSSKLLIAKDKLNYLYGYICTHQGAVALLSFTVFILLCLNFIN